MDIDPRLQSQRLRFFLALADELHFGRAAARLGIAQPRLSQQIRLLEEDLGYALFERTSRQTRLTEAGATLAEAARRSVAELEHGLADARRCGTGALGSLAVGYVSTAMMMGLHRVVREYRRTHPAVRVALRELATEDQLHLLRAGGLDVGFVSGPPGDPGLVGHRTWRDPLMAVLPEDHRLSVRSSNGGGRPIAVEDLAAEPLVLFPQAQSPHHHRRFMAIFERRGLAPAIAQEAESWHSILSLVAAGIGFTVAPAITRRLHVEGVRYHRMAGETRSAEIVLCTRVGPTSPTLVRFLEAAGMLGRDTASS